MGNNGISRTDHVIAAIRSGRAMGRTPEQIHTDLTDGLGFSTEAACTLIARA